MMCAHWRSSNRPSFPIPPGESPVRMDIGQPRAMPISCKKGSRASLIPDRLLLRYSTLSSVSMAKPPYTLRDNEFASKRFLRSLSLPDAMRWKRPGMECTKMSASWAISTNPSCAVQYFFMAYQTLPMTLCPQPVFLDLRCHGSHIPSKRATRLEWTRRFV